MTLATIPMVRHAKDGDGKREMGGFSSMTKQNSSRTWRYTIVEAEATIETLQRNAGWTLALSRETPPFSCGHHHQFPSP